MKPVSVDVFIGVLSKAFTFDNVTIVVFLNITVFNFEQYWNALVDMLFKLAVSIEKQNLINSSEYDDYYEEYIEEVATENVQKRHGRL